MGRNVPQVSADEASGDPTTEDGGAPIVAGILGGIWLLALGLYALALIGASSSNVQCSDKVGLEAEASAWPLGYHCREQFGDGAVSQRPGPTTIGLHVFLIAVPSVLWWTAGKSSSPLTQRRAVAEALVFAGIGLGACAVLAITVGSTGLGAVNAAFGIGLFALGASYRYRTREVDHRTARGWADLGMVVAATAGGLALTALIIVWASS